MTDLHFEADPAGHPPLLLVHGFLSSRNHWLANANLSRHFRLIRVDLPAHGKSPAPSDDLAYTPEAMTFALDRLRQHLGIERWFICGQSFGAGLTLRYALDHPERVIAQAFTNANAALRGAWDDARLAAHQARIDDLRENGRPALRRFAFHPCHARRFPEEIRKQLASDADNCDVEGIIRIMRMGTPRLSVIGRLSETQVPSLLINGLRERAFQPARDLALATLPGLQIADLDGGHSINIEQSEGFDSAVTRFFTACLAGADASHAR